MEVSSEGQNDDKQQSEHYERISSGFTSSDAISLGSRPSSSTAFVAVRQPDPKLLPHARLLRLPFLAEPDFSELECSPSPFSVRSIRPCLAVRRELPLLPPQWFDNRRSSSSSTTLRESLWESFDGESSHVGLAADARSRTLGLGRSRSRWRSCTEPRTHGGRRR